ncbi:hypothetical protein ACET7G_09095 [Aeromonas hydrophila]|uniref:hypothetical protein n=1 Tax=Aeromonas hydrophila TaxID=644 RepID=UPI0038CFC09A
MNANRIGGLKINEISFFGEDKESQISFFAGVNVVCGASDTGKSFLAETIDYMLGGAELNHVPELHGYHSITMSLSANRSLWRLTRSVNGGAFKLFSSDMKGGSKTVLKSKSKAGEKDNISFFLLSLIGLTERKILKSATKSTVVNLSFRDLARLIIIQEDEIQKKQTPFWNGQYVTKTTNLASVKLLLTGMDDSGVITPDIKSKIDNSKQIEIINEIIDDIKGGLLDPSLSMAALHDQLDKLALSLAGCRQQLTHNRSSLKDLLDSQRRVVEERSVTDSRLHEVKEVISRFELLKEHYLIDLKRLMAIQESGSIFSQLNSVACPVCGSDDTNHFEHEDIDLVVHAASSEVYKTLALEQELSKTIHELNYELDGLHKNVAIYDDEIKRIEKNIKSDLNPLIINQEEEFSKYLEAQFKIRSAIDAHEQIESLEIKKLELSKADVTTTLVEKIKQGLPDEQVHSLSLIVGGILSEWGFPGQCQVHFDKTTFDFIIDGKARARMGKGLRAITHSAITIGLLEFCQTNNMPHPGIIVLDSPLLAYFEPEEDDDIALSHTNLKDKFYTYLLKNHSRDSQVIIIENQAPPMNIHELMHVTIFTRNKSKGRYGLLS